MSSDWVGFDIYEDWTRTNLNRPNMSGWMDWLLLFFLFPPPPLFFSATKQKIKGGDSLVFFLFQDETECKVERQIWEIEVRREEQCKTEIRRESRSVMGGRDEDEVRQRRDWIEVQCEDETKMRQGAAASEDEMKRTKCLRQCGKELKTRRRWDDQNGRTRCTELR